MTLIHIGFPKTGTTSLQLNLLDRHPEIFVIGNEDLRYHNAESYRPEMSDSILLPLRNQDSLDYCQDQVDTALAALLDLKQSHQRAVVSDEFLTMTFDPIYHLVDRRMLAERLKSTFSDAEIVMTVRGQLSLLRSLYGQVLRSVGVRYGAIPPFEQWVREQLDLPVSGAMSMLKYGELVTMTHDVFGAENVTVLMFEHLKESPRDYAQTFCRLAGVDPVVGADLFVSQHQRPAPAAWQIKLVQAQSRNSVLGRTLRAIQGATPEAAKDLARRIPARSLDTTLSHAVACEVVERFRESNELLSSCTGLDLHGHGYLDPPARALQ